MAGSGVAATLVLVLESAAVPGADVVLGGEPAPKPAVDWPWWSGPATQLHLLHRTYMKVHFQ